MKKVVSLILCVGIIATLFLACGDKDGMGAKETTSPTNQPLTIRYLNFKPEVASVYNDIAADYKAETGVTVIVETAASGTYESTLKAKMSTDEAPTIFQINGVRGYAGWKDYCADLSDTKLYAHLADKTLAITSGDKVYGIPNVVEGYGIIYNNAIFKKYFALPNKAVDIDSVDKINSFATLKAVTQDMTRNKAVLGIDGAFASTSLKSGEDWRWQTHLANVPISYEFAKNKTDLTGKDIGDIEFSYADNYRNLFDLYLDNSVTDRKMLGSKIVDDSMAEFALGKCAMVQNGNWAWSQINAVAGNKVKAEDIGFLPLYMGLDNEAKQGICIGTENFLCINEKATATQKKAAADFLYWLYSSEKGKKYVTEKLGFISPFDTFSESESPNDPLAKEVLRWMKNDDVTNIPWNFTVFPSQTFKDNFGANLLRYAQGTMDWLKVKAATISDWKAERAGLMS